MTCTDDDNGNTVESDTDIEEHGQITGNSNESQTSDVENDSQGRETDDSNGEKVNM